MVDFWGMSMSISPDHSISLSLSRLPSPALLLSMPTQDRKIALRVWKWGALWAGWGICSGCIGHNDRQQEHCSLEQGRKKMKDHPSWPIALSIGPLTDTSRPLCTWQSSSRTRIRNAGMKTRRIHTFTNSVCNPSACGGGGRVPGPGLFCALHPALPPVRLSIAWRWAFWRFGLFEHALTVIMHLPGHVAAVDSPVVKAPSSTWGRHTLSPKTGAFPKR